MILPWQNKNDLLHPCVGILFIYVYSSSFKYLVLNDLLTQIKIRRYDWCVWEYIRR